MSKPEDIPQNVWDRSLVYAGGEFAYPEVTLAIALAIMEERERCARIAEREWNGAPLYFEGSDISAAIRADTQ